MRMHHDACATDPMDRRVDALRRQLDHAFALDLVQSREDLATGVLGVIVRLAFGGVAATSFVNVNAATVTAVSPASGVAGGVDVQVTTADGTSAYESTVAAI